jgi:hypothetical protein
MKHFTRLLLATVCALTFAGYAGAKSVENVAETPKAEQASVVHLGKPLDCKVDVCPKVEEKAAAPAPVKTDKPLIDAYGMPTNMPTSIRGSDASQEVVISAPRKAKPAAAASDAQPAKSDTKPASSETTSSTKKPAKAPAPDNPDKIKTE